MSGGVTAVLCWTSAFFQHACALWDRLLRRAGPPKERLSVHSDKKIGPPTLAGIHDYFATHSM